MKVRLYLLIVIGWMCVSCSARYYMRRGTAIYETGRYYKAATKYERAFEKAKKPAFKASMAMRAGQCFEDINRMTEAYSWYLRATRADKEGKEAYLKMAEANIRKGDLEAAGKNYDRFDELFPEDERGKNGRYQLGILQKDLSATGRYQVELQKEFNSRNSDFGPVYHPENNDLVYFASTRKEGNKKKTKIGPVTGEGYSHIYESEYTQEIKSLDKRGNVKVRRFPDPRWLKPGLLPDSLLSSRDEGGMCFSPDGSTLYFTSSRLVKGNDSGTRIYKSSCIRNPQTGKITWGKVSKSGICGDTVSIGHPALTPDGNRMYFVTDRLPGGKGGKDIWYVDWEDGKWSSPQNAGEMINTEGNEMFPYVRENGELYFASDGHDGFGGLDLYRVLESEGDRRLEHLPVPLNSFSDDFGIAFKSGREEGLLTSSRSGRSDNLYRFAFVPQRLRVRLLTVNAVTEQPVPEVNVTAVCDDGTALYLITDTAGTISMEIQPQREYVFVTENPRFLKGKGSVSTYKEKEDHIYDVQIEMQPIEKPIVIPNIYFDLAKWDLRADAKDNLEELLLILKDNPNITIELAAHTDMIGNDEANRILSEKRAQSVVDYLIGKGIYWDRLEAKGYGETQPRQIHEKEAKVYHFLKPGDILTEKFINRLKGEQRETALQLNRRIEFRVLHTNYKPGSQSLKRPSQEKTDEGSVTISGKTQLKELKDVEGKFYTLQLGVFRKVPDLIYQFRVVFTEKTSQGTIRYCTGIYDLREEAEQAAAALRKKGTECIIIQRENK